MFKSLLRLNLHKINSYKNEAGYAEVCTSCSGKTLCQEMMTSNDTDIEDINTRMNVIKHKLIVVSGKGGVGKSTVACSMALSLAKQGLKVGVLDFDICGPSVANILKVENQNVVMKSWGWQPLTSPLYSIKVMSIASLINSRESAVIYKGPRKTNLIKRLLKETFWGKLDYLICDTPPGTSDEHLTIMRLLKQIKPSGAVIISTPQKLSMDAVRKSITFCRKTGLRILGIVENMSFFNCPCCNESYNLFPNSNVNKIANESGINYVGSLEITDRLSDNIELALINQNFNDIINSIKALL
jgi:Mrp family chromosome partitioning ATPase